MGISHEILDELLMRRAPRSPQEGLAFFISSGNPDLIKALLEDGADVNARGANGSGYFGRQSRLMEASLRELPL